MIFLEKSKFEEDSRIFNPDCQCGGGGCNCNCGKPKASDLLEQEKLGKTFREIYAKKSTSFVELVSSKDNSSGERTL
jgi:hypothetical protein